jgi:predicted 2-oxoglutarate/Fe(II)-dependent dioxygenase YbiX
MYENGLYHGHRDSAVMSAVSLFYREPKPYKGGELVFTEHRYTPDIVNNSIMIFPSFELHAVNPVQGPGRFSLNQFFFVNIS